MRNVMCLVLLVLIFGFFSTTASDSQSPGELAETQTWFADTDNDGYDDDDACPDTTGNSSLDRIGCLDTDGDGYSDVDETWNLSNGADAYPLTSAAWSDSDGDGYADQPNLDITDDCPLRYGKSREILFGCSDMDLDWIPDVLDRDIDGDGISNEMEAAASLVLEFYDPLNASSVPIDSDFDTLPDAIDDDDDNDGWPDGVEQDRGSDPLDVEQTPLNQYFGVQTGFFYQGGFTISSEYDAEEIEISLSGMIGIVTGELVIPFLLIPLYLYFFISRRRRFEALRTQVRGSELESEIILLEKEVNKFIENRKINTLHGLILRNTIEEVENQIRNKSSDDHQEEE